MRRHPLQHTTPPKGGYNVTPPSPPKATEIGSVITPFLVSGGRTYWQTSTLVPPTHILDPRRRGVQLLCAQYIPFGKVGFIKRLVAAPTVPSVIGDAFRNGLQWWGSEAWPNEQYPGGGNRANSANGLWETPMAWEGFFPLTSEPFPAWRWQISLLQGDWRVMRANADTPPFSPIDPASWYLVENIPVNRTDRFQFPGNALPGTVEPQRFPVLPRDAFNPHWMVPENNSILLWASWEQSPLTLMSDSSTGLNELAEDVYPIGPSVGQLGGYMQSVESEAACDNAELGWGG